MINQFDALISSAGFSKRIPEFKPLLIYDQLPFIITIILKTSLICHNIYIVLGHRSEDIIAVINDFFNQSPQDLPNSLIPINLDIKILYANIKFIINPNYMEGMFGSLQTGLHHMNSSDWILYHFVDQPQLSVSFYHDFSKQIDNKYDWIQPLYKGRKGHPIILNKRVANKIKKERNDSNLKSFSRKKFIRKNLWNCHYPQILVNYNTPEDLKRGGITLEHF
jgi:molybdenum cofactor cytidylyltransferase